MRMHSDSGKVSKPVVTSKQDKRDPVYVATNREVNRKKSQEGKVNGN